MNAYTQTRRLRAVEAQLAAPLGLTPNQTERLAMLLRGYAWSRGAAQREDDEEAACAAALKVIATLERTPS